LPNCLAHLAHHPSAATTAGPHQPQAKAASAAADKVQEEVGQLKRLKGCRVNCHQTDIWFLSSSFTESSLVHNANMLLP
jgi:hypothetical protein